MYNKYTISKLIQNPKNHFISTREYTQTPTSEKKPFSPVWKCRTNISSGLTVQFPYLEKNPRTGWIPKWRAFFRYIIYLKKKTRISYAEYEVERMEIEKESWNEKRSTRFIFVIFFRTGVFFWWILFVVIRSGMYIIFMEFVCILTPWFIEIWLNPKWMLRYRAKM